MGNGHTPCTDRHTPVKTLPFPGSSEAVLDLDLLPPSVTPFSGRKSLNNAIKI